VGDAPTLHLPPEGHALRYSFLLDVAYGDTTSAGFTRLTLNGPDAMNLHDVFAFNRCEMPHLLQHRCEISDILSVTCSMLTRQI
jgi:hypothetical protein